MIVRAFRLSDYSGVIRLMKSTLSQACYETTIEALAKQLSWDSELVLVAEHNGDITGMIIGTIDNNKGYYYRVAVSQHYQRQGIGKSMIAALKNKFIARKVKRIVVSIDDHSEPILPLYKSMGYTGQDFLQNKKLRIVNE